MTFCSNILSLTLLVGPKNARASVSFSAKVPVKKYRSSRTVKNKIKTTFTLWLRARQWVDASMLYLFKSILFLLKSTYMISLKSSLCLQNSLRPFVDVSRMWCGFYSTSCRLGAEHRHLLAISGKVKFFLHFFLQGALFQMNVVRYADI